MDVCVYIYISIYIYIYIQIWSCETRHEELQVSNSVGFHGLSWCPQGGANPAPQADSRQREQKPFRDIARAGIRMQTLCYRAPEVGSPQLFNDCNGMTTMGSPRQEIRSTDDTFSDKVYVYIMCITYSTCIYSIYIYIYI